MRRNQHEFSVGKRNFRNLVCGFNTFSLNIYFTHLRYFLEAQGYKITDNILYQDNKSSILLEKNGKLSSGKRTKHINIRYFFVTDRIQSGEVQVDYCPTGEMIAGFFTKPLQGKLFRTFRSLILNLN